MIAVGLVVALALTASAVLSARPVRPSQDDFWPFEGGR